MLGSLCEKNIIILKFEINGKVRYLLFCARPSGAFTRKHELLICTIILTSSLRFVILFFYLARK
jgi:hypothetical protein